MAASGAWVFDDGERFPVSVTVSIFHSRLWLAFGAMQRGKGKRPRRDATSSELPLGPLPSGRHTYSPEQVALHQRERLMAALAAVVAERGYAATTVGEIAAAAHVSRRVFYEHFQSKDECCLAVFDAVIAHLRTVMAAAADPHGDDWAGRVVAALGAALDFLAAEPDLARLCLLEAASAGPLIHRRFREVAEIFDPYVAAGRASQREGGELPESTEVSLIGGLAFKLARQIAVDGPESLPSHLPAYAEFLLTPYLGPEQARARACDIAESGEEAGQ